jgi:uncharacterized protein (TIGR02266 family)
MAAGPSIVPATEPAARARELLGAALGKIQDIADPEVDASAATASIAKAVGALFSVLKSAPGDPQHVSGVCQAMDHMREALRLMQEVRAEDPALHEATAAMARTLAMLYPISKIQERQSIQVDRPPAIIGSRLPDDPRRSLPRIAIEADVGFQSDTNFFTGFSEDISTGGIFIATFDHRPIGSKLAINFTLPDGHLVSALGVVRWLRDYNDTSPDVHPGMGVQFTGLSEDDRGRIDSFLEKREPMFYDA